MSACTFATNCRRLVDGFSVERTVTVVNGEALECCIRDVQPVTRFKGSFLKVKACVNRYSQVHFSLPRLWLEMKSQFYFQQGLVLYLLILGA
jgi:hypothetical protein